MKNIKFTNLKQCPYCGNQRIEYIDLSDIHEGLAQNNRRLYSDRLVFKYRDCHGVFCYLGKNSSRETT
jgi:hypothetical protein